MAGHRQQAAERGAPAARTDDGDPHRPAPEVDDHRAALQLQPAAQLVLDEVGVVTGHQPTVVDHDTEARRARPVLRRVEHVEAPAAASRRRSQRGDLEHRPVQDAGPHARRVALEEALDRVQQAIDVSPRERRGGDDRGPLAEFPLQPVGRILDGGKADVPLAEHDERGTARVARLIRDAQIALRHAFRRVDENQRDVRPLGGLERPQLAVVLDPLAVAPLAAKPGGIDQAKARLPAQRARCRSSRGWCRARPPRSPAAGRGWRSPATTFRRWAGRGWRRGSRPRPP